MKTSYILLISFILFFLCLNTVSYGQEQIIENDFFKDYETIEENVSVPDPLFWFNYGMYYFNDNLYRFILKPVTQQYKAVTPLFIRKSAKNFLYNIFFPQRFINDILQGKFKKAGLELKTFIINSTIGCLGFTKPAQDVFKIKTFREDLGQTFATYNIGEGCYLVLPLIGPSTLRDSLGNIGDYFLNPINYLDSDKTIMSVKVFNTINSTSFKIDDIELLRKTAIDPYFAMKNAYIQHRKSEIKK